MKRISTLRLIAELRRLAAPGTLQFQDLDGLGAERAAWRWAASARTRSEAYTYVSVRKRTFQAALRGLLAVLAAEKRTDAKQRKPLRVGRSR